MHFVHDNARRIDVAYGTVPSWIAADIYIGPSAELRSHDGYMKSSAEGLHRHHAHTEAFWL